MKQLIASLALLSALVGCSTVSPGGNAPGATGPTPSSVAGWNRAVDGMRVKAWVHDGVAVPPAVYAQMKETRENQVTLLMRSCSADGKSLLKVEHTRGRNGTDRNRINDAVNQLGEQEDNAKAAEVLDYALVVGHAPMSAEPTTTLRVFAPSSLTPEQQTPAEVIDAEQLFTAFPALAAPCPGIGEASSMQALSLRDIIDVRLARDDKGRAVRDFGTNAAQAAALFNEMSTVMASVRQPSQILGVRSFENGKPRLAQASKWELTGADSLLMVLELKDGRWTLRVQ